MNDAIKKAKKQIAAHTASDQYCEEISVDVLHALAELLEHAEALQKRIDGAVRAKVQECWKDGGFCYADFAADTDQGYLRLVQFQVGCREILIIPAE